MAGGAFETKKIWIWARHVYHKSDGQTFLNSDFKLNVSRKFLPFEVHFCLKTVLKRSWKRLKTKNGQKRWAPIWYSISFSERPTHKTVPISFTIVYNLHSYKCNKIFIQIWVDWASKTFIKRSFKRPGTSRNVGAGIQWKTFTLRKRKNHCELILVVFNISGVILNLCSTLYLRSLLVLVALQYRKTNRRKLLDSCSSYCTISKGWYFK